MAIAALAAFTGCARALAAATATANASVTIAPRSAGIGVIQPLILPTVTTTATVPASSLNGSTVSAVSATSVTSSVGSAASNAALTIYGESGDAVSMAVPQTFQVIRTGGTEALTVQTNTNAQYTLPGAGGVVLGGSVMNADTMSVNIGGAVNLASADELVPGPYEGLLVVVVQYN